MLKSLKWGLRDWLGVYRPSFEFLAKKSSWAHVAVTPESEICIEGFLRSANTFSVAAFVVTNPSHGHIARHTHLPAQVVKAIELKVPVLLLIRSPRDAALSLKIREPQLSFSRIIKSYTSFYKNLRGYRDAVLVCQFEKVVKDFPSVMEELNDFYGTIFNSGGSHEEIEPAAFDEVARMFEDYQSRMGQGLENSSERIAKPNSKRREMKEGLVKELELEKYAALLKAAEREFEFFTENT